MEAPNLYLSGSRCGSKGLAAPNPYWLLADHLGSTAVVANALGTKVGEVRYRAWGCMGAAALRPCASGTVPTRTGAARLRSYTGQRWEVSLGLYFYQARWYGRSRAAPALGRFVQPDILVLTIEKPQGLNRFTYSSNNPLRYSDPSGYLCDDEITAWSGFDAAWLQDHYPEIYYMLLALQLGDILEAQGEGFTLSGRAWIGEVSGNPRLVFLGGPSGWFQVSDLMEHPLESLSLKRTGRCGGVYEAYSWQAGERAEMAYQRYSERAPDEHHYRVQWWQSAFASLTISVPAAFLDPLIGVLSAFGDVVMFGSPVGVPGLVWGDRVMSYRYGDWELRIVVREADVVARQWTYHGYRGLSGKKQLPVPACNRKP